MFRHAKELQFNARVSEPDPRFAALLLEQFGGGNGELKAAMQYFVQAFAARRPYPDKYDLLMDVATEELSHLEIVGATITMLLSGVHGEIKDIADENPIMKMMDGKAAKEELIHEALMNPQFGALTGGGPELTNSQGIPWTAAYVNANGDLTVDLRSDMAAESRAKIVYEYLMKFTDDAYVKETLSFLMTREIAHFQCSTPPWRRSSPISHQASARAIRSIRILTSTCPTELTPAGHGTRARGRGSRASSGLTSTIRIGTSSRHAANSTTSQRVPPGPWRKPGRSRLNSARCGAGKSRPSRPLGRLNGRPIRRISWMPRSMSPTANRDVERSRRRAYLFRDRSTSLLRGTGIIQKCTALR
ncbi:manganese catalase family protein [Skermanella mucosa]|uniref:manganese catalase family protein n=1 Tax=Skermanella mucosa TaxID=1789672 RepID=UPI001E3B3956|nr:manganese catalase family protein [Skermanella mucosa]UEM21372.1 manganese catalase family protein [Skermanella mucosa]